ncbi:MAG: hypothetical protein OEV44_08365 [Spirochaetota bacterium]|nr:hypothetical protein [Spirochaetota bacterium]
MLELMYLPIILFIIASVIIVIAAIKLAHYGDAIAKTTGLGHSLVGIILLSAATSLPELFSSSSASFFGNVDLSFGNVFGSNMTNIFILVIMDFFVKGHPILFGVSQKNIMTGGIVIFISCLALLMMSIPKLLDPRLFSQLLSPELLESEKNLISGFLKPTVETGNFWYFSIILFLLYLAGIKIIYHYEKANMSEETDDSEPVMTKQKAILGFVISSIFVFGASILLSYSCDKISGFSIGGVPLGGTFVGTLFMAFTTSLPEVVVSIAALRLGSHDMALGNIFGSNLFNLAILSFSDAFYRLGQMKNGVLDVFTQSHPNHLISGFIGIIFIGIVLSSLMYRRKTKKGPLGFDTFIIGILYFIGIYGLFILR